MLFSFIYNIVFFVLIGICVYYTFLYSQMSEDISEIRSEVKKCNNKKNINNKKKKQNN